MGLPGRGVAIGGGGVLLLVLFAVLTGRDPMQLLETVGGPSVSVDGGSAGRTGAPQDQLGRFAAVVLASTEDVWRKQFAAAGSAYKEPTLVLFSGAVDSACGLGQAAMGPFYCPLDAKVYLDLSFFHELETRFGAAGDFAQAYVIAHEVGHHVQNLLGIASKVNAARERADDKHSNALRVRTDCQADAAWRAISGRSAPI